MAKKILMVALIFGMFAMASHYEHHYTIRNCRVTEVTAEGCMIVDNRGEGWFIEGEGYEIGQIVDLKMFDNNTEDTSFDDVIKKVVVK